jgi:hypothetical protein
MASLRAWSTATAAVVFLLAFGPAPSPAQEAGPLEFHLTFDKAVHDQPFSGRVHVLLSKNNRGNLASGPNWFNPEPAFAKDVRDWRPGEVLVLKAEALGHPYKLDKLPKGTYSIQAVMDFDRGDIHFSTAEGNLWGAAPPQPLDPATSGPVAVKLDKVYRRPAFQETDRVKLVDIESKLLTAFHGRSTRLRAAVILPKSYAERPQARYPVIYEIPGFGGDHRAALFMANRNVTDVAGVEMLYVVLDPSCRLGHHVFADSANNGPVGKALTEELIPAVEKAFRAEGRPGARFVTGHSSGGWSSLWLQVAYPDFFGGCWSTAPDPVDFRDFQRINLYERGANMFTAPDGKPRPLARGGGKPTLFYKPFSDMEVVMGHGGQLLSFEAVFSPRGPDGRPRPLWDRTSGAVDAETAKAWEKYDIRLVLERNWEALGPKLKGKVHVYMGEEDTFYLEGATRLLKESQTKLGSDAVIELFPGKNHGSLMDQALRDRIAREMAERYKAGRER